ncbi:motility protein A [bacterium]|nr:motility protein A [bacterium]
MDKTIFLGIFLGLGLLLHAIGIENGLKLFLHTDSILIVLGGLLGATLVHFPMSQLLKLKSRLKKVFFSKKINYFEDIKNIIVIVERSKKEGRRALIQDIDGIKDHFLKNGLTLIADNVDVSDVRKILRENINFMDFRHDQGIRFFEQMGKYAPGFGLIGTLIGLVLLLAGLSDPENIGANMSIALVTTLYGVLLSNLIFFPLAGRMRILSNEELLQKEMYLEGLVALSEGASTYVIREKMSMLLPLKERMEITEILDKKNDDRNET